MNGVLEQVLERAGEILLGKQEAIRLAVACLLGGGHLLIEDQPGMGKTTLAHLLARLLGLSYQRIQFTSDLLPADIIGVSIFERDKGSFRFHPGPVFTELVLADEINRATPKTQSALLEAMEERQVTVDGHSHSLNAPFFVIATQNPVQQIGTFPLPESQLDRFLMRISLGYPDAGAERELLQGRDRRELLSEMQPILDPSAVVALQRQVRGVYTAPALVAYVQRLLGYSRESSAFERGLSPRAGLGLLQAARAWAWLYERDQVLPEDVQAVGPAVVAHRLGVGEGSADLFSQVPVV